MKQKKLILSIVVATIFFGCNNVQDKKVKIKPLEELEQVDNLLSAIAEEPQQHTVPSDQATTVTGAKGTIIHVDPDRLKAIDGTPPGDSIQIELLELTDNASMILNNTQTVSNGRVLVTGGAYYLNMTSNGKQLQMRQGKGLEVEFPKLTDDEMSLFLGERDSLGQMNWTQANERFESKVDQELTSTISNFTKETPSPKAEALKEPKKPLDAKDDHDRILTLTFDDSLTHPELLQYDNVSFRVNDNCEYNPDDADNYWFNVTLDKASVEGEYIIVFEGMDENGDKVIKEYVVTPVFKGNDYDSALKNYEDKYNEYLKQMEKREAEIAKQEAEIARREAEIAKQEAEIASRRAEIRKQQADIRYRNQTYESIELVNFGWINCDRFYNDPGPKTDIRLIVDNDSLQAARIFAVFKDISSILSENYYKGREENTSFRNIPVGKELRIIALSARNKTPYIFETTINTRSNKQVKIDFVSTTPAEIKERMKQIN